MATPITSNRATSIFMCVDLPTANGYLYFTTAWFDIADSGNTYLANKYLYNSFSYADSVKQTAGTTSLLFSGQDTEFNKVLFTTASQPSNLVVRFFIYDSNLNLLGKYTPFTGRVDTVSSSRTFNDGGNDDVVVSLNCVSLMEYISTVRSRTTTSKDDIKLYTTPADTTYDYVGAEKDRTYTYIANGGTY